MDNDEMLDNYAKRLSSTGINRKSYLRYASGFLDYANGNLERKTVEKYLVHLRKKHKYSDGTVNFVFSIIRTIFGRNNLEWPFNRGEGPQIREGTVNAPALHPNTIIRMIQAVKEKGEAAEKAFFALSTTYGLRPVEMVGLKNKDIRTKDKTIHIATAKHGQERTHLLPDEIIPYLKAYDFDQKVSKSWLWYRIECRTGLRHRDQVGWESVKRTLNTMLIKQLPVQTVTSFLRWKQRTQLFMPYRYSAVKFVGEEDESIEVVGEALNVDNEVFKVHPFIEYWR